MPLARIYSRAMHGIQAPLVTIEVDISPGLPGFSIVGLPTTAIKESKDRVRSAILNCNYIFPAKRLTVNLAPADVPKEGSRFDLAIALGILAASEQIPTTELENYEFAGELALSGELRLNSGILAFSIATTHANRILMTSSAHADEAALPNNSRVIAVNHLQTAIDHFINKNNTPTFYQKKINSHQQHSTYAELNDIRGQDNAKRVLEIAAAGNHSMLMSGPPGTGKTMLATRLAGILPPLSEVQALETAAINSIGGKQLNGENWQQRPFRAPHHSASAAALVGGGNPPRPGEISLAHHGVLFLDELPEFKRQVLETLREPLESGHIIISRAARQAEFPAKFQLIAAMNPCPCGHLGNPNVMCRCSAEQIKRYLARLSGPLLDRIDIHLSIRPIDQTILLDTQSTQLSENSKQVKQRVIKTHDIQLRRQGELNHLLQGKKLEQYCKLSTDCKQFMSKAINKLQLSARAYHRVLKVARTIADLAESPDISQNNLCEALSYRPIVHNY